MEAQQIFQALKHFHIKEKQGIIQFGKSMYTAALYNELKMTVTIHIKQIVLLSVIAVLLTIEAMVSLITGICL